MIIFYWFTCPQGHKLLITEDEEQGKKNISCERCCREYFISSGTCGEKYISEDFMSHLHG